MIGNLKLNPLGKHFGHELSAEWLRIDTEQRRGIKSQKSKLLGFTLIRTLLRKNLVSVQGFTLIELLVVVSIVGILIGISLFAIQGARQSSRDATRKGDLQRIVQSLELYKTDAGSYPATSSFSCGPNASISSGSNVYLFPVPCDPINSSSYVYIYTGGGNSFSLTSKLETGATLSCGPLGCSQH